MKRKTKIKKALALALALCLVAAYFPMQASAEDTGTVTITSQDDWDKMNYTPGSWPQTIEIQSGSIDADRYVYSNITVTNGSFTAGQNFGMAAGKTVEVTGGTFTFNGNPSGNAISDVTVSGGAVVNNGWISSATVSSGTFTNKGKIQGLTLSSNGTFTNEGSVEGTVEINGGAFNNEADGKVTYPVTMSAGTFTNRGSVKGHITMSGGTFQIADTSSVLPNITMHSGEIKNNTSSEITVNINGSDNSLAAGASVNEVLATPTDLKLETDNARENVNATWNTVNNAESYEVKLYSGSNPGTLLKTQTANSSSTSCDFTQIIKEKGYGTYSFTVQALASDKVASPVAESESDNPFTYTGPSGTDVTNDNYAWDYSTRTLTIKTDDGCLGWRSDADILGTLISDDSYKVVEHVAIGTAVTTLAEKMFEHCSKAEDIVVQANSVTTPDSWATGIPDNAIIYYNGNNITSAQSYECLVIGITDGQVFKGRTPDYFTVYGAEAWAPTAWEITGPDTAVSDNFTKNDLNTYTVEQNDMNLDGGKVGKYTLTVTYEDGIKTSIPIQFTILKEDGSGGDPGTPYPPIQQYTITSSADQGGTITPLGTKKVYAGFSASYDIKAAEGYILKDVLVDGNSVGPVNGYTFKPVYADHTIHAIFEKKAGTDPENPNNPGNPGNPNKPDDPHKPGKPDQSGDKTKPAGSKTDSDADSNAPKTGDGNDLLLWLALAAAAGGAVTIIAKKRKQS